jgi:AraC-like DNA-binding protein
MVQNFFEYFPASPKMRSWGLYATSFGQVQVPPHTPYPPRGHPEGHHFDWNQGRILQDFQILYIRQGQGIFESALTKTKKINPGTIFLLFPGVWHRYRPDPASGWTESWIELSGSYLDQLQASGLIDPKNPVHPVSAVEEVESVLEAIQRLVRHRPSHFVIRLGFYAAQILTLIHATSSRHQKVPQRIHRIVAEAQTRLAQDLGKDVSAEQVARSFGVGYSYFRREFKNQTGLSPKQYRIEIRHRRTKDLLRNSKLTIKEISEQLGYSSSYHLSLDFSKRTGLPPTRWRAI